MSQSNKSDRRRFLRNTTFGVLGAGILSGAGHLTGATPDSKGEPGALKVKKYNMLGRTGFKTSDIASGGPSNVSVLNVLLDAGVNYIDTAESYQGGQSEIITGQGIKNRDRKSLFINSKLHLKPNETKESILKRARKCLERLDTPYLDCMMMHNAPTAESVKNEAFHEAMKQLKQEGKLRFIGISNHGPRHGRGPSDPMDKVLIAAAQDGRFDVMLLIYNFIQEDMGKRILAACKEKNMGTTLMKTNPVGKYMDLKARIEADEKEGKEVSPRMKGRLESMKDEAAKGEAWVKKYGLQKSLEIRAAATRFGLSDPRAQNVLCRCSSFEDAEHFLKISGTTLSAPDKKKLAAFREGPGRFYCRHACGLCESSCPHGVPVNTVMRYNHYFDAQGLEKHAMQKYATLPNRADLCAKCNGNCQTACPFSVPVHALLAMAHERLSLA